MKMKQNLAIAALVLGSIWSGNSAQAQDFKCTTWDAFPKGAKEARTQHVMYRDAFKAKKYTDALGYWQPLFEHVTSPVDAPSRHFDDGIEMYYELAKLEADAAKKTELLEKMNTLYNHKAKCLGESVSDRAYQAYYLYYAQYDVLKTIEAFEKLIASGKEKTPSFALTPIAPLTVYMFGKSPKFDKAYMIKLYYELKGICEKNPTDKTYQDAWLAIDAEFKKIEDQIFDCNYYLDQITPQYRANPNDQAKNADFLKTLKKRCGEENALYVEINAAVEKFKADERAARWDEIFNAATAYEKGQMLAQKGEKEESAKWYEKAFDDPKNGFPAEMDNVDKGKSAYSIAYKHYQSNSYGTARSWCRKASEYRPNWGEPYILVGMMYASSGKSCGTGTGWDSQSVIWAAMDEWQKARSVDASSAAEANKYINQYSAYLPEYKEVRMRNLNDGESYKIGCWINVTTTIRSKK